MNNVICELGLKFICIPKRICHGGQRVFVIQKAHFLNNKNKKKYKKKIYL